MAEGRVVLRATNGSGTVRIEIADTGDGMSADLLPRIFDRFKQGTGSMQARTGLGLGLAVAREIVLAHDGTIEASSAGVGGGSTFSVVLPLTDQPIPVTGRSTQGPAPDSALLLKGLDLLVVDDEADARELLQDILESYGARPRAAASAAEAIRAIDDRAPDVLISDLRMPEEDGYTLIRRIRAREGGRGRLPAIAVTADARLQDREQALAAGYDLHLAKPVDPAELAELILALVITDRG